jgi:hypothetical protein
MFLCRHEAPIDKHAPASGSPECIDCPAQASDEIGTPGICAEHSNDLFPLGHMDATRKISGIWVKIGNRHNTTLLLC